MGIKPIAGFCRSQVGQLSSDTSRRFLCMSLSPSEEFIPCSPYCLTQFSLHGMLIRTRRRYVRTTYSNHWLRKYPNLIVDFTSSKPNELWVSDITYWKIEEKVLFLHLITDAFSRKIVGFQVSETLHGSETAKALKMAWREQKGSLHSDSQLIHHSDRGSQYCAYLYVNLLKKKQMQIPFHPDPPFRTKLTPIPVMLTPLYSINRTNV
jgi:hypothetical protein